MSVTETTEDRPVEESERPPEQHRASVTGTTLNVFSHTFLVVWLVMAAAPLVLVVLNSFRPHGDIVSEPFGLPTSLEWDNFTNAWTSANIGRYALNSLIILAGSLTGTMLLGAMAAYVLARFDFPGNRLLHLLFVGGMMFPIFLALVPLFFVLNNMGLLNTRQGLILVYIAYSLPFTIFFLVSFFRTLPGGVQEAAMLDGASHSRTFFQVMLPMAKPGLISIGIFNFLGQWNQFVLPRVLNVGDPDDAVLPQGLAALMVQQGYEGDWGALYAGVSLAMLPVLTVYVAFQRQVQNGLTAGAVR
ncbi:N-acetylglucosamine transport system permease protein [Streptomyces zhaozhouensis]|uniref:N-acetylglucosamine transport system permease protein n=1 Tax=Streptomyces zhaozhouensis TaxID=1300267 RepID=A0A286DYW9_9ACTN|nr:carbohydrate ABC transporter permease [Streptomyces zhaozhouensis]SOD63859.1 N-acetylglucosamine transport system permease protein [Streptomyces zhaozhouensis]